MNTLSKKTSLKRYYMMFGGVLVALMILTVIIQMMLPVSSLSGVSMITPFLAAMFTGEGFLKRERRFPDASEKNKLIWSGLAIFLGLNFFITAITWSGGAVFEGAKVSEDPTFFVIVLVLLICVVAINFFLMRWAYGSLLKKRAEKLNIGIDDTFD